MIEYRKSSRKPISVRKEIELLSQFPFGGLIGEEMLPNDLKAIDAKKILAKVKRGKRYRNIKHFRKDEELLRTRNIG